MLDPDFAELPTDYVRGTDFKVVKTSKGGYADYSTSNWARRERALEEAELTAVKDHGPFNLKDFLPKKPGEVELKVMKEMFEASVDGEAFDMERWGQYFKPAGYGGRDNAEGGAAKPAAAPATRPTPAPVAEETAPWEEDVDAAEQSFAAPAVTAPAAPAGDSASSRAQDILAAIRNRNK